MAEQPDGAAIVDYWNSRGVPFEALEMTAAGFASSSVRAVGRAARDKGRIEALVKTAYKVGLAGGWELHDRVAFAQVFSDRDVAETTPVESAVLEFIGAVHSKGHALSTPGVVEVGRTSGLFTEQQAVDALQSLVQLRGLLVSDEGGFFRLSEEGERWIRSWGGLLDN